MKKRYTLILLAVAAAATSASAAHLTPEQALDRLTQSPADMRRAPGRTTEMRLIDRLPELYVFSSGRGFMVLPADDAAPALLGYTDTGTYDAANPTLRWWLDSYARQIEHAAAINIEPRPIMRRSRPTIAPMLQTRWNQDGPYNNLTPEIDGKHAPTGCVATAMAQAMKFHAWPEKGTGSHSYSWQGKTLSFDYDATTFRWDEMTDTYGASSTDAERTAVATLMYAAGVSVDMNYTASESGTASRAMGTAFLDYFNYDRGLQMPERDYYGLAEWEDMVYDELAAGRPVLYGGTGSAGGHQFVCDGYTADGYFHFNWGWGGMSDGNFLLTALDPPSLGIGGGAGGFNYNQVIVTGLQRPVEGSETAWLMYCSGFSASTAQTTTGTAIEFGDGFYNYSFATTPAETKIGLIITPAAGGEPTYVEALSAEIKPGYGTRAFSAAIPQSLADGTYTVTPGYQIPGKEWTPMRAPLSQTGELTATVSGNNVTLAAAEAPELTVENAAMATPLYWGSPFRLTFDAVNNGAQEYYGGLIPALLAETDGNLSLVATATPYPVDIESGGSSSITYTGTFASQTGTAPAAGTYLLALLSSDGQLMSSPVEVTLNAAPATTSVAVRSLTLRNDSALEPSGEARFDLSAECTEGYFAGTLTVAIFDSTGGTSKTAATSPEFFLEAGDSATEQVNVSLDGLGAGNYMAAVFGNGKQLTDPVYFTISATPLGLTEIDADTHAATGKVYDLSGRRVNPAGLHGIFIANGRKVRL